MIPAAGFSLNDFFATARFAITVYEHIQLGYSAPKAYLDFQKCIHDFGNGLKYLAEILQEHERHLFNSGAKGTARGDTTSRVQRTLSEVVGDFKTLEESTLNFLKHYKFMVPSKKGGVATATWKKVKVHREGSAMHKEIEVLKSEYMFHTAKVNIVIEPLRILLLSSLETTLIDIQQTVNRIEKIARSLYTQTAQEPSGIYEPLPEESVSMSCEFSSGYGVPPPAGSHRFPRRSDTGLSDTSTFVSSPNAVIPKRGSVFSLPNVDGGSSSGSSTAISSTVSEWVWLHEQFAAALSRSVGLEQTKLAIVLDEVVRWLEEGRRGIRDIRLEDSVDAVSFVNLCKASWLCGKLLKSHQYQTLDANSLWHPYIGKIADSIRKEFEDLKKLRLKLPNIKTMRPPLPSSIFDIGLPPAIGGPGIFGHSFDFGEQEILRMDLPGYGKMEREVTLVEVQGGDTIRLKDKIGHGTEWTVTPNTLKRSKTTVHPSIPFMQGSGLLQRPHLILKNIDNSVSVGFEFSDYKQLNAFQAALTGYKIVSQLKQVGKVECYYHSKLLIAKTDIYDQTSVQLWHEQRALQRSRQPSTYSGISSGGGKSLAVPLSEPQSQYTTRAHRTFSHNSTTAGSISAATSSTSSSISSSKGSHTVKTREAKVEQSPECSKLVIFARPNKGASKGVEIIIMEIDPYTMISHKACCSERKPDPKDKDARLCCLRIVIEKRAVGSDNDGKSLRLLGFREPEQDSTGNSGTSGGPLGPGLPLNVDAWPEKSSRSQKAQGLAISFNTEHDKRRFIEDFEGLQLLALSSAESYR